MGTNQCKSKKAKRALTEYSVKDIARDRPPGDQIEIHAITKIYSMLSTTLQSVEGPQIENF